MQIIRCEIDGLVQLEPKVFGDARGFFLETYNRQRYQEAGIPAVFVQDNLSFSKRGILRGLHFQNPAPQGKLVTVLQGEVFDVAVDIRRGSPTFGQSCSVVLDGESKRQFYIPPGFAHGFQVLSETALFFYKCTELYAPQNEVTVRWDDPRLNIKWPLPNPILSARDSSAPLLKDIPAAKLFD